MRVLRVLCLVPAVLSLQACWFVFIPGSLVQAASDKVTGAEGSHCITAHSQVGDTIALPDGSQWVVESTSGTSSRCTNPQLPIRAKLSPRKL